MENTLTHHGIKGMRWGVRRTEAQLARARGRVAELEGKLATKKGSSESQESTPKKRTVSDLSDAELRAVVNRMQLEKQYRDLNPQKVSAGKRFVSAALGKVIAPAVQEVAKNTLKNYLEEAVKNRTSKSAGKK